MSYQSNPRAVEESYDHSNASLLPGINSGVNSGASNSARGEGTTAAELGAKFRMLNCGACLFVLLFHTLRIAFNPVRLARLLSSPARLILEAIAGLLALSLLLVEARVPILGEKVLRLMEKIKLGGNQLIDLDVARGRALALIIVGGSLGMINHLNRGVSSGKSDGGDPYGGVDAPSANATDVGGEDASANNDDAGAHAHMPFVVLQSILSSPTAVVALTLAGYTLYAINTFPEYAESRAYSQDGSDGTAASSSVPSWVSNVGGIAAASSSVPSWAGNVGDIVQGASSSVPSWVGNVGDMVRGSGYQNVST